MGSSLVNKFRFRSSIQHTLTIQNLGDILENSQQLQTSYHEGYGQLHTVRYENQIIHVGKCEKDIPPSKHSLHWLILPSQVLVLPSYTKLEKINISQYSKRNNRQKSKSIRNILLFMKDVCQFCMDKEIGVSGNKLAFSDKWCLMSQTTNPLWNYQQLLKNKPESYLYLSPELIASLAKHKLYPHIDIEKSDTFILGMMMLEVIAEESIHHEVYNYQNYQIKLKPIIKVLTKIKNIYGYFIYKIFLKMLELDVEHRLSMTLVHYELENYLTEMNEKQNQIDITKTYETQQLMCVSPVRLSKLDRSPGTIRRNLNSLSPLKPRSTLKSYGVIVNRSPLRRRNSVFRKVVRN